MGRQTFAAMRVLAAATAIEPGFFFFWTPSPATALTRVVSAALVSRRHFEAFKRIHAGDRPVLLFLSSQDPEIGRLLDWAEAEGSCLLEPTGEIHIRIHDAKQGGVGKAVWLEELAHAIQYIKDGNVDFSRDNPVRAQREKEVAACLIERASSLRLTQREVETSQRQLAYYGRHLVDG